MANNVIDLTTIPLEDKFKTSLSQQWTGGTGTVYVASTPNFTFPSGQTCYIVVNPGKDNMQIAEINAYNSSAKTLTVSNVTLEKGASVNSIAQTHNVGSEVIISDNYQVWLDILDAVNSKVAQSTGQVTAYTDATARDAAITSPANGMQVYLTTEGYFSDYVGGAWSTGRGTTSVGNASTTVAGKVEIAADTEVTAGTGTGGTGAVLSVTPTQANKLVSLATTDTTSSDTDYYMFQDAAASDINKRITQANLRDSLAASDTLKGTVEKATDAEVTTATDTERYITPNQLPKIAILQTTRAIDAASGTVNIAHGLSRTPKYIEVHMRYTYAAGSSVSGFGSHGFSDGTNNKCTYTAAIDNGASVGYDTANDASNCINFYYSTSASEATQTAVATFDGTNIDLAWTKTGALSGVTCYITIAAYA